MWRGSSYSVMLTTHREDRVASVQSRVVDDLPSSVLRSSSPVNSSHELVAGLSECQEHHTSVMLLHINETQQTQKHTGNASAKKRKQRGVSIYSMEAYGSVPQAAVQCERSNFHPHHYLKPPASLSQTTRFTISNHPHHYLKPPASLSQTTRITISNHPHHYLKPPASLSQTTHITISNHPHHYLKPPTSLSQTTRG
ncbi:hypothetical protein NHX12_029288 [Muraenolepis orangiensis]|uniref:Uncharacterized protein n=1 Tax=Muraenolepis orangiensis TaxID=630683 RepID=A0A9Q0EFC6_9TELE|nr:hypothetical protein NHX12_029288 [Muraenolepis orangiensis]